MMINHYTRGGVYDDGSVEFCCHYGGGVVGSMVLGISNAQAGADLANNTDEEKKAMADIILHSDNLLLHLDKKGGAITGFWQQRQGESEPVALLRPLTDGTPSCFPLVPFGNRVKDNHFTFNGQNHTLEPNTDWDRHYLHGEGWQAGWSVVEERSNHLVMEFEHRGGEVAYNYQARQTFTLSDDMLEVRLAVKNIGQKALPFGLGWHPYFVASWQTTLWAPAQKFWTEAENFLPDRLADFPPDVNFSQPKTLPERWVNNGLQDWIGKAIIHWPEQNLALHLEADPLFRHAFVFVPGEGAPPHGGKDIEFGEGYFCFEPMSHLANGHNLDNLGNLTVLSPQEEVAASMRLRPQTIL